MFGGTYKHPFKPENCSKIFYDFNLVSLKDCLITGFQGNMASKPVQFVRTSCEHISALQQTMAFGHLPSSSMHSSEY